MINFKTRLLNRISASRSQWGNYAAIVATLGCIILVRSYVFPDVFRGEHVVLLANDPYYYRHFVVSIVESGGTVLDLPQQVRHGEPLLVATLVGVTQLLGNNVSTAEFILAWYPVLATVLMSVVCYLIAVTLSRDRRVGLATLLVLAITPVHAYRTALGFADHHAFDFLWLTITVFAAIRSLSLQSSDWKSHFYWTPVLVFGVAGQTLSWNAAPLLFVPLVVYSVVRSSTLIQSGGSLYTDVPLIVGIGSGGILTLLSYQFLGWQSIVIVTAPALTAIFMGFCLGVTYLTRRWSVPTWSGSVISLCGGLIILAVVIIIEPTFGSELRQEITRFIGMSGSDIRETRSLFTTDYGLITSPLFSYGTALFFALPAVIWALMKKNTQPRWLLVSLYSMVFLVYATIQIRFAGELSLFVAIFGGLGFVYLLSVVDITEPPKIVEQNRSGRLQTNASIRSFSIPTRSTVLSLGLVFLLIGGFSIIMTPIQINSLVPDDEDYEAAVWMENQTDSADWPQNQEYVFSQWGESRMYNSIVSGESRSYAYAQANYQSFISGTDGGKWYDRLDNRVGFVVIDDELMDGANQTVIGTHLTNWGSELGHYQVVWASESSQKKVYIPVEGAVITGTSSDPTVTIRHHGTVSGEPFIYKRTTSTAADGSYTARVPYPGEYTIDNKTVVVSEAEIHNGTQIQGSSSSS